MTNTEKEEVFRHYSLKDYGADKFGNVYSFSVDKAGRIMKQRRCQGYYRFTIRGAVQLTHRFILQCIDGESKEGQCCRHLNGNPYDNRYDNLSWGTHQENAEDRINHGRSGKALTIGSASELYRDAISGRFTYQELQDLYGVGPVAVWKVKTKKTWSVITDKIDSQSRRETS